MEQLDPQTREQYALFFAAADTDQDGQIGQEDAKSFYTKSGLGTDTLARIWQQINPNNAPVLTPQQFALSLQLIALVQHGRQASVQELAQLRQQGAPIPLPSFPGLQGNGTQAALALVPTGSPGHFPPHMPAHTQSQPGTPPKVTSTMAPTTSQGGFQWALTGDMAQTYQSYFKGLDSDQDGLVGGQEVMQFFASSQLPPQTLALIWERADLNKDGKLDVKEFCLAMFLVSAIKHGQSVPTPLPASLLQSIWGAHGPHSPPQPHAHLHSQPHAQPQSHAHLHSQPHAQPQPHAHLHSQPGHAHASSQPGQPAPRTGNGAGGSWVLTPDDHALFGKAYQSVNPQRLSHLDSNVVRNFLMQSGLPVAELGNIYALADVDRDGRLTQPEFYIAMKLVANRRAGADIPASLPAELLASVGLQQYASPPPQQHQAPPLQAPAAPAHAALPTPQPTPAVNTMSAVAEADGVMEERVKELEEALLKKERENKALRSEKGALESRYRQANEEKNILSEQVGELEGRVREAEDKWRQSETKLRQAEGRLQAQSGSNEEAARLVVRRHALALFTLTHQSAKEQEIGTLRRQVSDLERKLADAQRSAQHAQQEARQAQQEAQQARSVAPTSPKEASSPSTPSASSSGLPARKASTGLPARRESSELPPRSGNGVDAKLKGVLEKKLQSIGLGGSPPSSSESASLPAPSGPPGSAPPVQGTPPPPPPAPALSTSYSQCTSCASLSTPLTPIAEHVTPMPPKNAAAPASEPPSSASAPNPFFDAPAQSVAPTGQQSTDWMSFFQ